MQVGRRKHVLSSQHVVGAATSTKLVVCKAILQSVYPPAFPSRLPIVSVDRGEGGGRVLSIQMDVTVQTGRGGGKVTSAACYSHTRSRDHRIIPMKPVM